MKENHQESLGDMKFSSFTGISHGVIHLKNRNVDVL